VIIRV